MTDSRSPRVALPFLFYSRDAGDPCEGPSAPHGLNNGCYYMGVNPTWIPVLFSRRKDAFKPQVLVKTLLPSKQIFQRKICGIGCDSQPDALS